MVGNPNLIKINKLNAKAINSKMLPIHLIRVTPESFNMISTINTIKSGKKEKKSAAKMDITIEFIIDVVSFTTFSGTDKLFTPYYYHSLFYYKIGKYSFFPQNKKNPKGMPDYFI